MTPSAGGREGLTFPVTGVTNEDAGATCDGTRRQPVQSPVPKETFRASQR